MENAPYCIDDVVQIDTRSDDVNNSLNSEVVECSDLQQMDTDEANRGGKRTRKDSQDQSSEEGWSTVTRGRKIVRLSSQTEVEEKTHVCVTSSVEALPKQFAFARLLKENNIRSISRVKYIHQFKMFVTFDEDLCANEFVKCKAFSDLGWRCQKTSEVGTSYGVIKDVELDFLDEDIIKNLYSELEITSAKRLDRRNNDETSSTAWVKSESVRLGFRGSVLPTHVFIHGLRVKVEPFIFPVTQCSRCWKFGHSLRLCPSKKVVCPKCSKGHANCETTHFRCVNCTGDHMALQKICPSYKKERRIRELMAESNVTYRKAQSMYVPPPPAPERDLSPAPSPVFPCPTTQKPQSVPPPVTAKPEQSAVPLMSDLFKTNPEDNSFKVAQSRKKYRKLRQPPRPPTPPAPMESDWSADKCQDTHGQNIDGQDNSEPPSSNNRSQEFSFMRLLIKFKNILFSKESLENKIQQAVSIISEWIISCVSNISGSTLMSTFMNVVINEYG